MNTEVWRPAGEACESTGTAQCDGELTLSPQSAVLRIVCFCTIIILAAFAVNMIVTDGLRKIKTSAFGTLNQVMDGKVNADIVITGSSRALAHYDPRTIESITGRTAFNLGRNGSQTDMQVVFLKAYLDHNRPPQIVVHNLDAFSFVTTREVFNQVEYTPYLYDRSLYNGLRNINPNIWKSRDVPLYGYVVEDMNFTWIQGVKGFVGWSPRQDYFLGFNPRSKQWSEDFEQFKADKPNGVSFEIEPAGVRSLVDLIDLCRQHGIQLILVYSPEYSEMQAMTTNRAEIFGRFHDLSSRYDVPLWDYSQWKYAANREYFQNSQHLNARGAEVFSDDLAIRLKTCLAEHDKAQELASSHSRGIASGVRQK